MVHYSKEEFGNKNGQDNNNSKDHYILEKNIQHIPKKYFEDGKLKDQYVVNINGVKYPLANPKKPSGVWSKNSAGGGSSVYKKYDDNVNGNGKTK